jgi:hypothetical protein
VQRAQSDGGARHAGLCPGPLIRKPDQETPPTADPCTNAPRNTETSSAMPAISDHGKTALAGIMPPRRQFQREIASDSVQSEPGSMQRWRAIEIGVDELQG